MGKVDEAGQLYEAHILLSGEIVWFYSDDLHRVFQVAELHGINAYTLKGLDAIKKLLKKSIAY